MHAQPLSRVDITNPRGRRNAQTGRDQHVSIFKTDRAGLPLLNEANGRQNLRVGTACRERCMRCRRTKLSQRRGTGICCVAEPNDSAPPT